MVFRFLIMIKKMLISLLVVAVILAGLGVYAVWQQHLKTRQARQNAKAPQISVTFLEGWSNQEIANYLEKNGIVKASDFLIALKQTDTANYSALAEKPQNSGLEGFLFPDTYFIPKNGKTPRELSQIIIKKALDNFQAKISAEMISRAKDNGINFYQTLILASIIEKETGRQAASQTQKDTLQTERQLIAGIFYNRLNAGMPLQSDATVNFITQKNDPTPSEADTKIDSPYNTYQYKGLPPGPICNPSLSSILAALNPTATNYFYFLHNQKTGQAFYAQTYEEHLANKQKYLNKK